MEKHNLDFISIGYGMASNFHMDRQQLENITGVYLSSFCLFGLKTYNLQKVTEKLNQIIEPYSQILHRCYSHPNLPPIEGKARN